MILVVGAPTTEVPHGDLIGSPTQLFNDFELSDGVFADYPGNVGTQPSMCLDKVFAAHNPAGKERD